MSINRFAPMLVISAVLIVACGASTEEAADVADSEASVTSGLTLPPRPWSVDPCDEDGDGFLSPRCGGNDCCDTDASTHPGQTDFFSNRNACGSFDYNCDGFVAPNAGIAVSCQPKSTHCAGSGFVTETPCGVVNTFVECKWKFGCRDEKSQRIQQCR